MKNILNNMKNFNFEMSKLYRNLGSNVIEHEFEYLKEHSRRFPENERLKKYGILPQGINPSWENMIYASGVQELRVKHLQHISDNGINAGHKVRKHLDWLEKIEGKQ